jgi:toxin ParE1/3/4
MSSQGLGTEFVRAIDACLGLIVRNPLAFPVVHREARMALPGRFPYKVIYRAKLEAIIVVAVMHSHRHPKRWQKRID